MFDLYPYVLFWLVAVKYTNQCSFHICSKDTETNKKSDPETRRPPSQLLLKPEPPRGGKKPKTHVKTNVSIIIEFGLQVLLFL